MAARIMVLMMVIAIINGVQGWHQHVAPLPNRFRNEKGTFAISWAFPSPDVIEVEFTLAATGWIGIAFGGSMFKSDMVIGYIAVNGSAMVCHQLS